MGLDVGGNIITQASSVLTMNTGANLLLRSTGGVVRPSQPLFTAIGGTTAAWVYWTTEQIYNKVTFTNVTTNVGSCYSAATSRFTAPVAGSYFFQYSIYLLKDVASDGTYFHPLYYVNGFCGDRHCRSLAVATTVYVADGLPMQTYVDGQAFQIYQLAAGDYAEAYIYSNGGWNGSIGNRRYPPQERFYRLSIGVRHMVDLTITITDDEMKALEYVAVDPLEWITNFTKVLRRCRHARGLRNRSHADDG